MVGEPADQAKIDAYLAEMQKIVASAAGANTACGDVVTVTAMDFLENQLLEETGSGIRIMDMLSRNLAGIINFRLPCGRRLFVIWMGRPSDGPQGMTGGGTAIAGDIPARKRRPRASGFRPAGDAGGGAPMDGFWLRLRLRQHGRSPQLGDDDGSFNRRVKEGLSASSPAWSRSTRNAQRKNPQEMGGRQRRVRQGRNRPFFFCTHRTHEISA